MNVRVTAISLLGRTRGDTVRRCLIDFTRDPSPTVVARACNLLENETITEAVKMRRQRRRPLLNKRLIISRSC